MYVSFFSLNIVIRFFSFSSRLPKPGETIFGTRFEKKYGGKGANQCIAATKLGASTALIASVCNYGFFFFKFV